MAKATQQNRFIGIQTPLGPDKLLLKDFSVTEELGRLFNIEAQLASEDGEIDFDKLIGHSVTIRLNLVNKEKRYFNGIVSRLNQISNQGGFASYQATIVPWLWLLTRTSDCYIFQDMTVPQILEDVFKFHGFDNYQLKLSGTYKPKEFCVQYCETDFNFVSRLMEQEGIYYYFHHEDGKHTLVLADSIAAHAAFPGYADVTFHELEKGGPAREAITDWTLEKELQPVACSLNSYDFKKPKGALKVASHVTRKHGKAQFEMYEYPGEYLESGDGDKLADIRLQELQCQHETVEGEASARGLASGCTFKLKNHARSDQNREYLLTEVTVQADAGPFAASDTSNQETAEHFSCEFTAIDKAQQFRPERISPKPLVQGPQTAVVVGPSGEAIHTDQFGRIKLHFHWDRHDTSDDSSSCWVRVSQNWGGKNWGGMFIPHVGQEVVVSFEEGDPDRPLITGRVYNPDQMPPVPLPGGKTKSAIRDHGGNEIIMEGKDGVQFIHTKQKCANELLMDGTTGKEKIHTKQKCGNEILMDGTGGSEKIEIRDKYGNEIVLDAVKGIIRIYSPTHESEIVLGRSLEFWSVSDYKINIGGKEAKVVDGSKHENILGLSSKLIAGVKQETVIGLEAKFNFLAKFELIKAYCVKKKLSKEFSSVKEACVEIRNDVQATALSTMMAITNNYDIGAAKIQEQADEIAIHGEKSAEMVADEVKLHAKMLELCGGITLTGKPMKNPSGQDSGDGALVVTGSSGPSPKPAKKRKKPKLSVPDQKRKAARQAAKAARRMTRLRG
jgi:type VI secretion system secreted protein VgrG